MPIVFYGSDNTNDFGRNLHSSVGSVLRLTGLRVMLGNDVDPFDLQDELRYANRCTVNVGENTTFSATTFFCQDDDSLLEVWRDSMLSWEIDVWCTDIHHITGMDGTEQNFGRSVEIDEHVWVVSVVKNGKNTRIPADSIVGWSSVVTTRLDEPSTIVAGNPAKVVKHQTKWDRKDLQNYARRRRERHLASSTSSGGADWQSLFHCEW